MFGYWVRKNFGPYICFRRTISEQYSQLNDRWYPYHSFYCCWAFSFLRCERAPARVPSMIPVNDPQLRVRLVLWRMVAFASRFEEFIEPRSLFKLLRLRHRSLGGILKEKNGKKDRLIRITFFNFRCLRFLPLD